MLNPSDEGLFFLGKEKFINTIIIRYKDRLLETNTIKTGCYLTTGELITIDVKVSTLFNKNTIEEVYQELEK